MEQDKYLRLRVETLLWRCLGRVIRLGAILLANRARRMMRRTTSHQLMVYLEPVTVKTPFGLAKPARKMVRRRDIYAEYKQICGCRLRQRSSGGSEVRSSHTSELPAALETHGSDATIPPVAAVLAGAMLHETNQNFSAVKHVLSILRSIKLQTCKSLTLKFRLNYNQFYYTILKMYHISQRRKLKRY